ncbi:uncharacterized protein JCM10292_004599 [Rhodotorula paludigena]|uniref:uncharacterized protein n=1 Tax=Rhodotorula paludigena TaxID=86838 RepID=UPI00316D2CA3
MTIKELAAAAKYVQAKSKHKQLPSTKLALAKVFKEQAAMEGEDYNNWIEEVCTDGFLNSSSGEGGRYGWLAVFFAHKFGLKTSYFSEVALSHAMVGFKTFLSARKDPHCPMPGSVEFGLTFTKAAQDAGFTPEEAVAVLTGNAKASQLWRFIWRNFSLDGLYEKAWPTFQRKIACYFNPVFSSHGQRCQRCQRWTGSVEEALQRILVSVHKSGIEEIKPLMLATMFYAAKPEHFRTVVQIAWRLHKYHGHMLAPRDVKTLKALGVNDDTTPSRARKLLCKKSEAIFDKDESKEGKDNAAEDEDDASEEGDDGEEEDDPMADADDDDNKVKDVNSDDELEVVQSGDNKIKVVESDDKHGVFSPLPKVTLTNHPHHADDKPEWAAGLPVAASHLLYKYKSDKDHNNAPRYCPGATRGFCAVVPPDLDNKDLQYEGKKRSEGGVIDLTLKDDKVNVIDPYGVVLIPLHYAYVPSLCRFVRRLRCLNACHVCHQNVL